MSAAPEHPLLPSLRALLSSPPPLPSRNAPSAPTLRATHIDLTLSLSTGASNGGSGGGGDTNAPVSSQVSALKTLTSSAPTPDPLDASLPSLLAARYVLRVINSLSSALPGVEAKLARVDANVKRVSEEAGRWREVRAALARRAEREQRAGGGKDGEEEGGEEEAAAAVEKLKEEVKAIRRKRKRMLARLIKFLEELEEEGEVGEEGEEAEGDTEDPRQKKIDEMFGAKVGASRRKGAGARRSGGRGEEVGERGVLKGLVQELLLGAEENDGDGGYVQISRSRYEAAKFLVEAGVAKFDRSDARRVRLVDFGRGFE